MDIRKQRKEIRDMLKWINDPDHMNRIHYLTSYLVETENEVVEVVDSVGAFLLRRLLGEGR